MSVASAESQPEHSVSSVDLETKADLFFQSAREQFAKASIRLGVLEKSIQIDNKQIRMRFAGQAMLEKITPAFEHLEIKPIQAASDILAEDLLTILIWDSESSACDMLRPPWNKEDFSPFGQVISCSRGRYRAVYEADGGLLSMTDLATNTAIYWARDSKDITFHVLATPLRAILSAWLNQFALEFVHAAAVGNAESAVLVAGKGGAGKSSTAISCLEAGLQYLSDDYCLVSAAGIPQVFSVYSTAKIVAHDLARYSIVDQAATSIYCKYSDKHLFYLNPLSAANIARKLPIRAILFPHTGKKISALRRLSEKEAFCSIAESSSALFPYTLAGRIGVFGEISRKLPAYAFDLGPDRSDVVKIIKEVLETPVSQKAG